MKVIEFKNKKENNSEEILKAITDETINPMIVLGYDKDKNVVLTIGDITWQELAHLKTSLDAHVMRDWLGLL